MRSPVRRGRCAHPFRIRRRPYSGPASSGSSGSCSSRNSNAGFCPAPRKKLPFMRSPFPNKTYHFYARNRLLKIESDYNFSLESFALIVANPGELVKIRWEISGLPAVFCEICEKRRINICFIRRSQYERFKIVIKNNQKKIIFPIDLFGTYDRIE